MASAFADWLAKQPRGAASRIARKTGISYPTILRARAGERVQESTARLISEATGGEVAESDIPQVAVGHAADAAAAADDAAASDSDDEPRAVA